MTLAELISLIQSGEKLSEQQLKDAQKLLEPLATGKVPASEKDTYGQNAQDYITNLNAALQTAMASQGGQQFMNDLIRERQSDRFVRKYKPYFNALIQGADIGTAISQIRSASKAAKDLIKPGIPAVSKIDPALDQALAKAQSSALESERATAPVLQDIADQYQKDIALAKQTSGGQASVLSGLGNAASLRRQRGLMAIPGLRDQIRARRDAQVNALLGLRQQGIQNADALRLQSARLAQDQYNQQAGAIGLLGQTGRMNLRNSLSTLPDNILGVAGRLLPVVNPYGDQFTGNVSSSTPSSSFDAYGRAVEESLANNLSRIRSLGPNYYK